MSPDPLFPPIYLIAAVFPSTPALLAPAQDPEPRPACRGPRCWQTLVPSIPPMEKLSHLGWENSTPPTAAMSRRGHPGRAGGMFPMFPVVLGQPVGSPECLCAWERIYQQPLSSPGAHLGSRNKCGDAGRPPPSLSQPPQPTSQSLCDSRTSGVGDAGDLPEHPAQPPALLLLLPGLPWHGSCCRRRRQG